MAVVEAMVLKELWDVDRRLQELDLVRDGLLTARDVALHESANATPFHPANAPGTFSYHHGTWSLRDQFVGRKIAGKQNGLKIVQTASRQFATIPSKSKWRFQTSILHVTTTIAPSLDPKKAPVPRGPAVPTCLGALCLTMRRHPRRDGRSTI